MQAKNLATARLFSDDELAFGDREEATETQFMFDTHPRDHEGIDARLIACAVRVELIAANLRSRACSRSAALDALRAELATLDAIARVDRLDALAGMASALCEMLYTR